MEAKSRQSSTIGDPFGEEAGADPYGYFRALRATEERCPVVAGVHFVTRYDDVVAVSRDSAHFANSQGGLIAGMTNVGLLRVTDEMRAINANGIATRATLQSADPPGHDRVRRVIARWLSARRVNERWLPVVEAHADRLVDALPAGVPIDFMEQVAIPLPIRVIAEILGVDISHEADMKRWSDGYVSLSGHRATDEQLADQARQHVLMTTFFLKHLTARREDPRDDLLSELASHIVDDGVEPGDSRITVLEALDVCNQLLVAGNETTTQYLGDLVELLGQHPDAFSQVRADRALLPNLLEEALRLSSPVLFLFRHTPEPVELAGAGVPKGAMVAALYASANRDPDVFEDPESFCPERVNADRHVAFGSGIHFCVGAALARAEAYACASGLLDRFSGIQLGEVQAGDDTGGIKLRSRKHLRVTFV